MKLESLRTIALKMDELKEHGQVFPAKRPEGAGLICWYCGVKLYFIIPNPEWQCTDCKGTGFAYASEGNGPCYKCGGGGKPIAWTPEVRPDRYVRDHVIPRSRGGSNRTENLVDCCWNCNSRKGSKTLEEFRVYLSRENDLGRLHDELRQWEESRVLCESDRDVIAKCRRLLTAPPVIRFYGEGREYEGSAGE